MLIARFVKSSFARLRPIGNFLIHCAIKLSSPGVVLISGEQKIAPGVRLRASDNGCIVLWDQCKLSRGVEIVAQRGHVEVGSRSFIGSWSTVVAKSGVLIGADCLIAERVTIRDQDHRIHGDPAIPIRSAGMDSAPIKIGNNVWIGAGAVILKGVAIGAGAVVAANAVVNRNVAENEIVGGVPARRIGMRKNRE
jgi:acetyltransferase-like isoleucine patch superfamily enzyme